MSSSVSAGHQARWQQLMESLRPDAWGMHMAQTYPFAEVIILEKFLDTSDPDVPA